MRPKTDQTVRIMNIENVHAQHWLPAEVHYNAADQTADVYIHNVCESLSAALVHDVIGWRLQWNGLSYELLQAFKYPCTRGTIVVTVPMKPECFDKSLCDEQPRQPRGCCASADRSPEPYIPTRGLVDGYGGGVVWSPQKAEFTF